MQTCSVKNCNSKTHAKGLCKYHYKTKWRTGSVEVSRPCYHEPVEQKFWHYVKTGAEKECWEWLGYKDKDGYGKMRTGNTNQAAHRISWQIHNGEIPTGQMVLHKCNNPSCINPSHLYLGDHLQNMQDRLNSGHYPKNEDHPNVKFPDDIVEQIRKSNKTYKELSQQFNISASQISNIKRGVQRIPDEGSDAM